MEPDPSRLLTPADLEALRSSHDDLRIVDVAAPERFVGAHIPGSLLVTPTELVHGAPPAPGELPEPARLATLLGRLDLRPETLVVAADDEGGGWAGRLLWTLEVLGHRNWAYLDGGVRAWQADSHELVAGPPAEDGSTPMDAPALDLRHVARREDVEAALADPQVQIWDARSREEYTGERVNAARGGHIPGARNLDWLELMDPARELRLHRDAAARIADAGIDLSRPIITHCQSHHRSGLSWLVARLLGADDVRAYPGSWSEWGNRADTPVTTGPQP